MTYKEKAAQKSSHQNTHANYSTHIAELELLLVDQLRYIGQAWPFGSLIERMKSEGFSRAEVVNAVNNLETKGVIEYHRHTHRQTQPWPRVELQVVLVDGCDV
jgi:hypothetical protein